MRLELFPSHPCVKLLHGARNFLSLDHTHDVRGTSQIGGVSEQLIVALFLNHLLCSVDRASLP